jgi:hypothetical protein
MSDSEIAVMGDDDGGRFVATFGFAVVKGMMVNLASSFAFLNHGPT